LNSESDYYIGLMSGTSLDGIDAVLVDFATHPPHLIASRYEPFNDDLRDELTSICFTEQVNVRQIGELDTRLGLLFGACVNQLLEQAAVTAAHISGIGSHGQTIYHAPGLTHAFTWQIGDPNRIAELTGITTVADFRRRDMAAGGQGAPLVPAFHQSIIRHENEYRGILNIGGIANLTLLPPANSQAPVLGFDSGPGNTLMDRWIQRQKGLRMDKDGAWARSGQCHSQLLARMLNDDYFKRPPPKSTGQEYFSMEWLNSHLKDLTLTEEDVQATLCQLTVQTILDAAAATAPQLEHILICGGGAHNSRLMELLAERASCPVSSTDALGLSPDWIEAMAFAWMARQTLNRRHGNMPAVTGARSSVILGGIYPAG
jgi:anhydro-N-acetylmuramic acid kinase